MANTTTSVKEQRLMALATQWERDPRFKEFCRMTWEPEAFQDAENRIEKLKQLHAIEARHTVKSPIKYFDISEIDVEAWEKQLYD